MSSINHAEQRVPSVQLGLLCGFVVLSGTGLPAVSQTTPHHDEAAEQVMQAVEEGRFELAERLAIVHFRAELHCRVKVEQARARLRQAQTLLADPARLNDAQLQDAATALRDTRALADAARSRARLYDDLGWDDPLVGELEHWLSDVLHDLAALETTLETHSRRAQPLDRLMALPDIPEGELDKLDLAPRVILGFHLLDRGAFDTAVRSCFQPARIDGRGALREIAAYAAEVAGTWHTPASSRTRWDNLVNKGLDAYDRYRAEHPEDPDTAGWLLCLVARLARDHYDVPQDTIADALSVVQGFPGDLADRLDRQLLTARLHQERFLLRRRAEQWSAEPPPRTHLELFEQTASWWYAAEAALIAAAAGDDGAFERCQVHIETLRPRNTALAEALNRRARRYTASRGAFAEWMSIAQQPDYRDRRGTVLPDVLIETRSELSQRVRRGFENIIAELLAQGRVPHAFREAQRAKALAVGRTLTPPGTDRPAPLTPAEAAGSKLLSMGQAGTQRIPRKELFVEYFVGPTRAWAFYLFAGGDRFEDLEVVELNRADLETRCRALIAALRANRRPPDDPGRWLFGGSPTLADLWQRLEDFKRDNRLRRMVLAPDGLLCCVPWQQVEALGAASIQYLPTAAALQHADHFEAGDVRLMWTGQCDDLRAEDVRRVRGSAQIALWPGSELSVLIQDSAE